MPITEEEFSLLMPHLDAPRIAVAVSGGADSMCLVLLANAWAKANGKKCVALTVDHGLRKESAAEAAQVAEWMRQYRIEHYILPWQGRKPTANVQAEARETRYRLMSEWCHEYKITHLLLAHHQDDQAETFLLRLGRGSGVDGLSGISEISQMRGITLVRPLLSVSKARLIDTLKAQKQEWVEDTSNQDTKHARNRMRRLMPALAEEGLTPERLAGTAHCMQRARRALESFTRQHLKSAVEWVGETARIDMPTLLATEEEITLRALAHTIRRIGGEDHAPRLEDLERLLSHLKKQDAKAITLGHCLFRPSAKAREKGIWQVSLEKRAESIAV